MKSIQSREKNNGVGCLGFMLFGLPIIIGLALLLIFGGIYTYTSYNKIIEATESVNHNWSNVETAYQKRADLIPNLVATVKGYAEHEQETFTAVTEARSSASSLKIEANELSDETIAKFEAAQEKLSSSISRLLAVRENYPELKADQHFMDLQNQLKEIENEIVVKREEYNDKVKNYNILISKFPRNIVAKSFGYTEKAYFKASEKASEAPKIEF